MELGRGGGGERRKEGDVEEELLGFVHTAGDVHLIAKVVILESKSVTWSKVIAFVTYSMAILVYFWSGVCIWSLGQAVEIPSLAGGMAGVERWAGDGWCGAVYLSGLAGGSS